MPDRDLFAEGRAVDASIEPGPWRTEPSKYIQGRYVIAPDDRQIVHAAGIANRAQDAEAIVWMRNNLATLLDKLEEVCSAAEVARDTLWRLDLDDIAANLVHKALTGEDRNRICRDDSENDEQWQLGDAEQWARWFGAERDAARLDRASELVAIAAKQQRDSARLDAYRNAMRDVRRLLADFGITNPPPRLRAVLEGLTDE